jgi:AraC-like DNA-binding protein
MSRGNSITSAAALWLIESVRARGKPVERLCELCGIDSAAPPSPDQHIVAEKYLELWDQAMRLVQDPGFAIHVGSGFDLEALEAFGFLAISCETLRDAYERTVRFRALYNAGSRWDLEFGETRMRMVWTPWSVKGQSEIAKRSVNEYEIAEMLASIRKMTQKRLVPDRIAFRHRAPADVAVHRELLGRAPEFGADFDGFEADIAWLAEPIRTKNARLCEYFDRQCQLVEAAFARDPPFTAQVRQRLTKSMNGPLPDMSAVARALAVSQRSLHRRLGDEGTRFNDLLDEVRKEFAERYLTRPNLNVGEIAYLIGFHDSSAFFKAFRRWTGTTPSDYRKALASEPNTSIA